MTIWKKDFNLDSLNASSKNTLIEHLNIQYTDFDDRSLTASMEVSSITHQPLGMLHGGASVVLIETVASLAANLCVDESKYCVGLEVNANHLRAKRDGKVFATAKPAHLGSATQVWQIELHDEKNHLICIGRLTLAVIQAK